MAGWLLILFFTATTGVGVTQAGPFADQAACNAAGQAAQHAPSRGYVDFVCVPSATVPKD